MLSYLEISKENLLHNFKTLKSLVKPGVKMVSVVKANAYGHGQNQIVRILEDVTDYFQVDDFQELGLLRQVSKKTALVLGYVAQDEIKDALKLGGILAVYDEKQILEIEKNAKELGIKAKVHIKIDAALGRQGVLLENVTKIIDTLKKCEHVCVDGVYSHFANIEDTADFSHAQKQIDIFKRALDLFKQSGYVDLKTHMSASSGMMVWEKNEGRSTLVRAGISLYGMWPSEDLQARIGSERFELKPVARWISHVAQVKTLPENYSIGYGLTYVTDKPTKIAVIPQGYSDGYDRGLSNCGEILIGGTRCRVLGRIAMNMFVVDVTHMENVEAEDEVVLLGAQGTERITAEEIAEKIGTINYEITTRICSLLPKIII